MHMHIYYTTAAFVKHLSFVNQLSFRDSQLTRSTSWRRVARLFGTQWADRFARRGVARTHWGGQGTAMWNFGSWGLKYTTAKKKKQIY